MGESGGKSDTEMKRKLSIRDYHESCAGFKESPLPPLYSWGAEWLNERNEDERE